MDHKVTTDYTRLLGNANVKVYVRARPCADGHNAPEDMFERKKETPNNIVIKDTERMQYGNHAFSFDNVLRTFAPVKELTWNPILNTEVVHSHDRSIGPTQHKKHYSTRYAMEMLRPPLSVIARCTSYLESLCVLENSFSSNPPKTEEDYDYEKANFEIHEDAQGRVFVKDLSMVTVTSREEVDAIVQCGLKLRSTHETKMNAVSSRSHTVFTIHVFQQVRDTEEVIYGMLNMVDLAGSERLKKSESDGQRLKEALHINSSLSAVGKVVMSLDPESGYNYIPYRDSKLTRLLQNSIGGNCFTTLIATIHPMREHYEECLGTLQFANRCRSVQNQPRVNHINGTIADKDRRIRRLQEELSILRRQLEGQRAEYNNRFVATLNELGFQAEEISENGEIKFADGLVLKSVFSEEEPGDHIAAPSAFLKSKHLGATGHVQGLLRVNEGSYAHQFAFGFPTTVGETRNDRDRLRQKYANAKSDFTVVVTEAKKDKENARCVINEQKRRIATLESCLQQKSSEYERALVSEAARHRAEMQALLSRNNQTYTSMERQMPYQQLSASVNNPPVDASEKPRDREEQFEQRLRQQVATLQRSKENEIALIRKQYDQSLKNKTDELGVVNSKLQQLEATTKDSMDNLREDCLELYTYVGRLVRAVDTSQRTISLPKNILADPTKLRHMKAIMTMAAARLPLQHPRSAAPMPRAIDRIKLSRPVSAPVRRTKPTYATALRDRVNHPLVDAFTFDHSEEAADDGRPESKIDGLRSRSRPREQQAGDGPQDTTECRRLMSLLEEERKKTRALNAANAALTRQQERNSLKN
ncbi:hypothetical protein PHYPSEUDO_007331 [Phytophthora pseudosyringae]|uniref:Kinesin-like protein n=1 Tax=Phytophthora pseudosyringae TaxID=221518 RepID=A0A8T1WM14_9STRA|nr:hypothetical protein PHYPSEUDO_007331 [Phytophthora pseudosyringae]